MIDTRQSNQPVIVSTVDYPLSTIHYQHFSFSSCRAIGIGNRDVLWRFWGRD